MKDLVERTWEEMGFRVRATGYKLWVRTRPHPRKYGQIWLPPKAASFYGGLLPHQQTVYATVLSAGPVGVAREFKPGDIVAFKRLHFAWIKKMEPTFKDKYGGSEEYVGTIDANDIVYFIEEADGVRVMRTEEIESAAATAVAV